MKIDFREDDHFGLCPVCHKTDGHLNVGSGNHVFVCHTHKLFWWEEQNIYTGWREESEELHQKNAELLYDYGQLERPFYWPDTFPTFPEAAFGEEPF